MAEILILALCATIAWLGVYFALPWMARLGALYCLHEIRDDVYDVTEALPEARNSRIYRDVEFLVTMAIHTVRERPFSESLSYVSAMLSARKLSPERRTRAEATWEKEFAEIYVGPEGNSAFASLVGAPRKAAGVVFAYVLVANPLLFLVFVMLTLVYVAIKPFRPKNTAARTAAETTPIAMASKVPQVTEAAAGRGTLDSLRALWHVDFRDLLRTHAIG